ncbi:MAG: transglutaminase domain-containing protein [Lachnospiraceae bacterium]|nr:transglutaminase domain-containing protein [Lachnospiraceae bacterium]
MKFENDYVRIEIEKKELTEEQKELHRAKRKKRRPYVITAVVLAVAILSGVLYGHYYVPKEDTLAAVEKEDVQEKELAAVNAETEGSEGVEAELPDQEQSEEDFLADANYVTSVHLATSAKEKYKDTTIYDYTYGDAIEDLERDEAIAVHMDFDPYGIEGLDNWGYFYKIYQNADLTGEIVGSSYDWDESTGTLKIAPPNWAPGCIATSQLDTETVNRYDHSEYILFDRGSGMTWGNLGTLYLACYYDEETGEKLEQPKVSIITLKAELEEAPVLSYSILEDGRPEFTWTPVEGASEYFICRVECTPEKGYEHMMYALGTSEETRWTTEAVAFSDYAIANKDFKDYRLGQDDWKSEYTYENYKDEYEPGQVVKSEWTEGVDEAVCVIAVSQDGTSLMSNTFTVSEMAPNLPHSIAVNTEKENGFAREYESVEKLPAYDYVTMCDGIINQKLIDYHTEDASVAPERVWYTDEEGNFLKGETLNYLSVPYVVEGTPFSYTMQIADYDEAKLKEDMKFLEDREEQLRRRAGDMGPSAMRERSTEHASQQAEVRQVEGIEIFANSALGEYLAANMLAGVETIDVSVFPEAKDLSLLEDVFMEAYYQNPLILGVKGYRINRKQMEIYVSYDDDERTQARKQKEIQEKLEEVIGQIVTTDMSDEEIELAINQYLCDTITYDFDALDNAEENYFMYVDESFNDSFTAYGALINGKCVCSGYAAAFKLLSETAGLESIVVTGILDGGLSHAWNKIKLDDEWQIVDVTNNDTDYISNALLNLPNFAGERILVEDKGFMMDNRIDDYKGDSESCEYYHMMDQYFPTEEIAEQLSEDLGAKGEATLRTDYDLDDDRFYEITDSVYEIMGDDIDLYGYYWLGVIYLTTEGF